MPPLILFIIKKFYGYSGTMQMSNGLKTSATFVVDMLLKEGVRAKLEEAIDGNSIDAIVTANKPQKVILEAIWVTPAKMVQLMKLHPKVKWTVRVHSEIPFLANEGMAIEWLNAYLALGVQVAFNSAQTVQDFYILGPTIFLPNYYPLRKPRNPLPVGKTVDVGCFGAIRPLKNQLIQAFAAATYAKAIGKKLAFHMNGTRIEQQGNNALKNITAFLKAVGADLVLHPWLDHGDFLELTATMDICLQVSFTETFCIVAADAVSMGVPLVGSQTIPWLPRRSTARVDSAANIVEVMGRAEDNIWHNHEALDNYDIMAVEFWLAWVSS